MNGVKYSKPAEITVEVGMLRAAVVVLLRVPHNGELGFLGRVRLHAALHACELLGSTVSALCLCTCPAAEADVVQDQFAQKGWCSCVLDHWWPADATRSTLDAAASLLELPHLSLGIAETEIGGAEAELLGSCDIVLRKTAETRFGGSTPLVQAVDCVLNFILQLSPEVPPALKCAFRETPSFSDNFVAAAGLLGWLASKQPLPAHRVQHPEEIEVNQIRNMGRNLGIMQEFPTVLGSEGLKASMSFQLPKPLTGEAPAVSEVAHPDGPITTLMMSNLPCRLTRQELMQTIDAAGFAGQYDFLYLPRTSKSPDSPNLAYGFVNLIDSETALRFVKSMTGQRFPHLASRKAMIVKVAMVQGLARNLRSLDRTAKRLNSVVGSSGSSAPLETLSTRPMEVAPMRRAGTLARLQV